MGRWVLRLLLLPLFICRDIWKRRLGNGQDEAPRWQAPYHGGAIAVVALYQSGQIRADVLAAILALRRRGVYVIAVNTGRLNAGGVRLPVDCYVERRNFGRDFGSYRYGVRLARRLALQPPRLILLNDSVFYVSTGLDGLVERLLGSQADVCSATESIEVRPHQTSFCLSFSSRCVQDKTFVRFWDRYRPSDIRPLAVVFGEIALSSVLRRQGFTRDVIAGRDAIEHVVRTCPDLATQTCTSAGEEAQDWCIAGNVTHRAPAALLEIGLPLIKLDLMRRVELAEADFRAVKERLDQSDRGAFDELVRQNALGQRPGTTLDKLGARCGLA